jgi:hypothetical protein
MNPTPEEISKAVDETWAKINASTKGPTGPFTISEPDQDGWVHVRDKEGRELGFFGPDAIAAFRAMRPKPTT